jgi:hypothetical protein
MERIALHLEEFVGKLNEELSSHPDCVPGMTITMLRPQLKYSYEICDPTRDPTRGLFGMRAIIPDHDGYDPQVVK